MALPLEPVPLRVHERMCVCVPSSFANGAERLKKRVERKRCARTDTKARRESLTYSVTFAPSNVYKTGNNKESEK